jgi:protein-disulfide isomerase
MLKLPAVAVVALLSLSPPLQNADQVAALKKQVEDLQKQQAEMKRDLEAIKALLQPLMRQAQAQDGPNLQGQTLPIANEPAMGLPSAKLTIVEISDYHCPFCRRQTLQTFPQIESEYVKTGKARYVFVDYPIAELHPQSERAHEAANCVGDQGKYWQMHNLLFANPPAKDDVTLTKMAEGLQLDMSQFASCMNTGKYAGEIRASVQRIQQLGIGGTPMVVVGYTPAPGMPLKIEKFIYGAQPFPAFKEAIDSLSR